MRSASWELVDIASGNMIEDDDREEDAIEALIRIVEEHGDQSIVTFALAHVQGGTRRLVAKQSDLVLRVEREREQLVPQRRTS